MNREIMHEIHKYYIRLAEIAKPISGFMGKMLLNFPKCICPSN